MLEVVLAGIGAGVGVLLLGNYLVVRASLSPPRTPFFLTPRDLGLPFQHVAFPSRDGVRLQGWWIPAPKPIGVAILCHGYLMNRCEPLPVAKALWEVGFHCLVFDFRASGKSEGKITTIGDLERLDVLSAVDLAERTAPGLPIVVYGASMGAAAALLAAAEDTRIRAVVADSAYARLSDAIEDWWRGSMGNGAALLLKPSQWIGTLLTRRSPQQVAPEEVVAQIAPRPLLIIHGTHDRLITPRHAQRLFERAGEPKRLWWAEGCEHVQARFERPDEFYPLVVEFMLNAIKTEAQA
ncbi:Monoacylglycerol lipase [bacterium HR14]|nr:Monoacylglycerol lipase [bacterium HR14]